MRKVFAMCSSICWPPGDSPASPVKPPQSKCFLGLDKIKNQRIKEFVSSDWFCARVLVRVPDQCDDPGDDPLVTCQPTVQCRHLPHLRPRLYPQPATSTDIETTGWTTTTRIGASRWPPTPPPARLRRASWPSATPARGTRGTTPAAATPWQLSRQKSQRDTATSVRRERF